MTAGQPPSDQTRDVVLQYAPPPRAQLTARHIRWFILWLAITLIFVGLVLNPLIWAWEKLGYGVLGTPFGPIENNSWDDRAIYAMHAAGFLGLFLVSQWMFLQPRGGLAFRTADRPRSGRLAIWGAGFAGMLITFGAAASVLQIAHKWEELFSGEFHFLKMTLNGLQLLLTAMGFAWVIWGIVFGLYFQDCDHRTVVGRLTRILLVGTIVELLISIPAYATALREQDDCYCAKGSYTGLVFGCTALFWLFGPGIFLLMLRERRRYKPKV